MSNVLANKARVILIVIRSLLEEGTVLRLCRQPKMQPPPRWIEDTQTCVYVVPDSGLFDCDRLAKKLAI